MNETDIWNELCHRSKQSINYNENNWENSISNYFSQLGWLEYKGDIKRQVHVKMGHDTKRADIVLYHNNLECIVIEVKSPRLLRYADPEQLFSYMRQLANIAPFGILWGDKIIIYYDDPALSTHPQEICEIELTPDNPLGLDFTKTLRKPDFSKENFTAFCQEQREKAKRQEMIEEEIIKLASDQGSQLLLTLLKDYLSENDFTTEEIEHILSSVIINIQEKATFPDIEVNPSISEKESSSNQSIFPSATQPGISYVTQDYNIKTQVRYILSNGHKSYKMAEFAAEIVRLYVEANPGITYQKLEREFPQDRMGCPSPFLSNQLLISGNLQRNRFSCQLQDGTKIYTSTQWSWNGQGTIRLFEQFVRRHITPKIGIEIKRVEY